MGIIRKIIISDNTGRAGEEAGYKLQLELEKRLGKTCHNCNFYITVIIAAINYIILFTRQYNMFNGIDFSQPEAWEELKNILLSFTLIHS